MPASNTYDAIESITLTTGSSNVIFSSIPQTYTDLVIVSANAIAPGGYAYTIRVNSDTGNNYSTTRLIGNGTSAASDRGANQPWIYAGSVKSSTDPIGSLIINLMNYSNTTTYKTILMRTNNDNANVAMSVGLWRNTAAITSVSIGAEFSQNFVVGSTFSLYGIKAA
jgi:hypothetical protein